MTETFKGEGNMTDWSLNENEGEMAMPDNHEWIRDFFELHSKAFADDRDRATFRKQLEENRIRESEAVVFMTVYLQGPDQTRAYLNERQKKEDALQKKETGETTTTMPFKKQEETPKDTPHKTAA